MKRQPAFTLIELLVVIAVIAVLMGILMPGLRAARELATSSACLANQKSLATAYVMYCDDNNGRIPIGFVTRANMDLPCWVKAPMSEAGQYISSNQVTLEDRFRGIRAGSMYPYLKDPKMYHCPGDKRYQKGPTPGQQFYRSYILPDVLAGDKTFGEYNNVSGRHKHTVMKLVEITDPGTKYMFVESEFMSTGFNYDHGGWTFDPWNNSNWRDALATYHKNSATFSFFDGHAERHTWKHKITWRHFKGESIAGDEQIPLYENQDIMWCWRRYPYLSETEKPRR